MILGGYGVILGGILLSELPLVCSPRRTGFSDLRTKSMNPFFYTNLFHDETVDPNPTFPINPMNPNSDKNRIYK